MQIRRARIVSVGTAVPSQILTNKDIEKRLDTTDEWIVSRSGIRERRSFPAGEDVPAYKLGAQAAGVALKRAGLKPADIDAVICATFTPDNFFPSTACLIAKELGCSHLAAFDLSAACSGFVYGLSVANALIIAGQCRRVLLVGSEIISKTLDWSDRNTCVLFGDAAGAVVLEGTDQASVGIQSTFMCSDPSLSDILSLSAWGENRFLQMKGQEVFKHAVRLISEAITRCLVEANRTPADVDFVIPHQANIRILKAVGEKVGVPFERIIVNLDRYGNTSSASIPLALDEVWNAGRIVKGTRVVFAALGGGVTFGSAYVIF